MRESSDILITKAMQVIAMGRQNGSQSEGASGRLVSRAEVVREGNLIYLSASSRLACQLDESRRQLDRLERHANRMLRSVGAR